MLRRLRPVPHGPRSGGQVDVGPHRRLHVGLVADRHERRPVVLVDAEVQRAAGVRRQHQVPRPGQVVHGQQSYGAPPTRAQPQHDVPVERVHALQPLRGVLLAQRPPRRGVLVAVAGDRCAGQAELRRAVVGHQQHRVETGVVLRVVLDAGAPATDRPRLGVGVVQVQRPHLRRVAADRPDDRDVTAAAPSYLEREPLVVLGHQQLVVGNRRADPVPPHLVRPVEVVVHGVDEPGRVGRPRAAVVGARHHLGEVPPGAQVAEVQREDLVPGAVDAVGEQRAVRAVLRQPEVEISGLVGQRVRVQDDLAIT